MTNTTAHEGYERIEWPEVRAGDVLMHENGDRLTVRHVDGVWVSVPGSQRHRHYWEERGFTPYRRKPEMPTEPGAYADKDGKHWMRDTDGIWFDLGRGWICAEEAAEYAPFTRLVPMPTYEQVQQTITSYIGCEEQAGAVMALLTGKEADR